MSLGKKLFHQDAAAAAGDADAAQGLVLHLDPNDEDSIESGGANQGNGSGTWFDISGHNLNVPLVDKASNLQLHLNASDTTSYSGSGTTWTDISGNSRNGTINGGVESTYATDIRGSFDFTEGTGDFVNVSHHVDIKPSTSGVTYELWITPEEISNTDTYLYSGSDSGYGSVYFRLENGVPSQTAYNSSNGAVTDINTGTALTAGSLHHVVLSISHTTNPVTKIYQDGTLKVTNTGSGTIHYLTDDLKIGRYTTGNANDFNGLIHAVRVYNTVLTASEVAQNFRAGNTFSYSSIYSTNLQMDLRASNYTTGSTLTDLQGNHNGTLTSDVQTSGNGFDKELGNYFNFDNAASAGTDTITVADNSNIRSNQDLSIEAWVWRDQSTQNGLIVSKGTGSTSWSFGWVADSNYGYQFNNYSGEARARSGIGSFTSENVWEHVVATYNNTSRVVKLYINGIETNVYQSYHTQQTGSGTPAGNTEDMLIGAYYSYPVHKGWDGRIGEFRFYKTVLTDAQVAQNYLATKNDYPNGYNATITGAELGDTSGSNPKFFNFNAKTEQIVIDASTHNGALQPSINTDMTYLVWVYFLGNSSVTYSIAADGSYILSGRGSGHSFYYRYYTNKLQLAIYDDGGTRDILENDLGNISSSTWYLLGFRTTTAGAARHHRITTGSSTFTDASGTMSDYETTAEDFNIGHYQTNYGFKGYIGAVQVYQRYLSDSEITAYYDANKATYNLS